MDRRHSVCQARIDRIIALPGLAGHSYRRATSAGHTTVSETEARVPLEIREHVKRQVEIMRPGGGFVFQQVHNVLADVPPENVVAMLDAVNT